MNAQTEHARLQAELDALAQQIETTTDVETLAALQARKTATETLIQRAATKAREEQAQAIQADLEAAYAEYTQLTIVEAEVWKAVESEVNALHEQITATYARRDAATAQRTAAHGRWTELRRVYAELAD